MNKIEVLNHLNDNDVDSMLDTWESSVRATHDFLSEDDIALIKPQVIEGIKLVSKLLCVRGNKDTIQAFMGIDGNKIEMLFVNNHNRKNGIGKKLIKYAIDVLDIKYVDVNEQNIQGLGFYKHMGFGVFKRSEFDEQGNPFPILHMKLK